MTLEFNLQTVEAESADIPCVVVGMFESGKLSAAAERIDKAAGGAIGKLVQSGDASGKIATSLCLHGLHGVSAPRVLLIGLGAEDKLDAGQFAKAARHAATQLGNMPCESALTFLSEIELPGCDLAWRVRTLALVTDHASYRFHMHGSGNSKKQPPKRLKSLLIAAGEDAHAALVQARGISKGVSLARDFGNTPPNICTPAWLAEQAQKIADASDKVSIEVLEPAQMRELGMGALLAVGEGSIHPPRLIVLRWNGAGDSKPYALVGKGVTFDSGGINIKPSPGMEEMKFDMCGGATVLGTFHSVVELGLPLNLVCVVPAAENMPGGKSYRPSDVLTTLSGITVEVLNTDAEGRLILCDALTYVQRFEPQAIVDVATLTGACVVALGPHASGLMSKDDALATQLLDAGEATLDRAWRLPLWDDYQSMLVSGTADVANLGGKSAGAITAGCFLSRFTEGYSWAHVDIAGTAWSEGRKGMANGRPVAMLSQWLIDRSTAG